VTVRPLRSFAASGGAVLCALAVALSLAPLAPASAAQGSGRHAASQWSTPTGRPDGSRLHHDAGTGVHLAHSFHGAKAVRKLGGDLTTAARINHRSPAQLRHLLTTDPTMWLTTDGRLYVKDELPQHDASGTSFTGSPPSGAAPAAPQPLDQTFDLHSLAGAPYTLYLDFDGQDLTGTRWNTMNDTLTSASGWDPAGDGDTVFSDGEKTEIQYIWSVVAEDYAPFDIDVTTADPGAAALNRTSSADAAYGTRVVFTDSKAAWDATCQDNCGGIAFIGAFGQVGSVDPALVFSLGESNDPWYMAAAAAHEAGHTFGLTHDGDLPDTAMTSYDSGHGLWGPIMGDPYNRDVAQWSDGEYANANNQQDDVGILRQDGLAERADEAGGTPAAAGGVPSGTAYISGRDDVDLYALGACTGTVAARATPTSLSPDLDIDLAIIDAAGQVVASDDPAAADQTHWYVRTVNGGASYFMSASGLDASLDTALDGGPYYLRVAGGGGEAGGAGDPVADYDDYGSMGAYQVSVSGCTQPATAPSAPAYAHGSMSGSSATVTWSAPVSDGGSAITAYDVEVDGTQVATLGADARDYTADGLSAGAHTIAVRARNGVDDGQAAIVNVRPLTVPGTPTGLAVVYSGTAATLSWVAPADDGGSPITGYRVVIGSFSTVVGAGSTSITISGFAPGVSYVVSLAAINDIGTGPAATTTVRVPVAPTAPTALSASADPGGSVTATWHAPSDDGGSAITGYQARLDGGSWAAVSGTSYTFTGAAAGAHTVDVAAINAAGTGPAATASAVVPAVPGAPTGLALTTDALGRTLTATWKAPDSDGGSAVTDYQVQVDDGAWHTTAGARSYATDPLTTGDHTVAVRAVNAVGSGVSVSATGTMPAPPTVPGVVTSFAATVDAANGQAQVVWGPPASDGGSAVTGYDVTVDGTTHHLAASATSYTIADITLGHHYAVGVVADNAVGSGPAQGADVVGFLPPGQVGSVSTVASATGRTLAVTWEAPASTGGSSSVTYQVRLGTGDWQDVTDPTYTFTGVVAGPTQVEIRAIGDGGTGDSLVVPLTMPAAPTAPSAPGDLAATIDPASGTGTLHWSAPLSDGGSPVTGYDVTIGGTTTTVTGTSTTLSGLTLGQPVPVSVKAINAVGASTAATTTITWLRAPDAVAGFAVTTDANALTATVTWAAPASDGGSPITGYDVTLEGTVTHLDAAARSWTATGLALGHDYPVSVVAVSAAGSGPAAGATVRLVRVATAPTLATPTVDPVHDTVALSWTAPGDNGGSAVTGYEIAVDGGAWTSVTGTSTTLSDVAEGSHTITVAADNAAGRGAGATVTVTMPHRAVPTAVRDLTITPDPANGSAVVSWVRPVENDSTDASVLPVTGYWITVGDGTSQWTTGGSYQLLGLHLGDTISVTVAAANVLGTGATAGASVALVRAPDPVGGLTAAVDATTRTTVHVGWTAPASDGGSPVTGYRVVATGYAPGAGSGVVASDTVVTGTSTDLTGLTLGTTYQIAVSAVTAVGAGGANLTTVIPTDVPGAVRGLSASADAASGTITVTWAPPLDDGGSAITGYVVALDGNESEVGDLTGTTFSGLTPGVHAVTVWAENAVGRSVAAGTSVQLDAPPPPPPPPPVTHVPPPAPSYSAPSAPGIGKAKPGKKGGKTTVVIAWKPPGATGGQPLTGYQVVVYEIHRHKARVSERVSAAASAHAVEIKLKRKKGVTYAFTVLANNAVGWSAASSRSNAVPPR
jgi:titin